MIIILCLVEEDSSDLAVVNNISSEATGSEDEFLAQILTTRQVEGTVLFIQSQQLNIYFE